MSGAMQATGGRVVRLGRALTWLVMGLALLSLAGVAWTGVAGAERGQAMVAPACPPNWQLVSSPNPSASNRLEAVAAIAPNDVWAVGYTFDFAATPDRTLTMHWDGTAWTTIPSPNPAAGSYLNDVVAFGSNNVWAAGHHFGEGQATSLIEHWDGTQWSIVPTPNQGPGYNELQGIDGVAPDDIWAIGDVPGTHNTVALHWDGTAWTIVPSVPNDFMSTYVMGDIVAVASDDVWAVGYRYTEGGTPRTVILHWDGTRWSRLTSPNPGSYFSALWGVTALSANEVYAVGQSSNDGGATYQTLVLKWDGSQWTHIPTPSGSPTGYSILYGITATEEGELWAVGKYHVANLGTYPALSLILKWDGSTWQQVSSPDGGRYNSEYYGVGAVPQGDVWAVGRSYDAYNSPWDTLIARNPCLGATPTPTATRTATRTATQTATPSQTTLPSLTPTATRTITASPTRTAQPSATVVPSATRTASPTLTPLPTSTLPASATPSRTPSASLTATRTSTATPSSVPSLTATATGTPNPSLTPTMAPQGSRLYLPLVQR